MIDVALFPIPNCVAFPGTVYPLHVFEPRYRQMIKYCLDSDTQLGICHTESMLAPGKPNKTMQEALSSNQATYKPYSIFSAGNVELTETLKDGRLLIDVHLDRRLRIVEEKQCLPFLIVSCEPYDDRPTNVDVLKKSTIAKEKLLQRLIVLTANNPSICSLLSSAEWQRMNVVEFSFELFGLLQMDGDIQQQILQCRSPLERLTIALQLLSKVG